MKAGKHSNWKRKGPLMVLFIIAGIAAITAVVMLLWNAILPEVTGVQSINYWQAMGILVLSKILFGGFGPSKHRRRNHHPRCKDKIMDMNPEQEDNFKSELKARWNKD